MLLVGRWAFDPSIKCWSHSPIFSPQGYLNVVVEPSGALFSRPLSLKLYSSPIAGYRFEVFRLFTDNTLQRLALRQPLFHSHKSLLFAMSLVSRLVLDSLIEEC